MSNYDDCLQQLHDHILNSESLSELRHLGPIMANDIMYRLIMEFAEKFQLSHPEIDALFCNSVTIAFWEDIPNI